MVHLLVLFFLLYTIYSTIIKAYPPRGVSHPPCRRVTQGDARHVHQRLVHTDQPGDGCSFAVEQHAPRTVGEGTGQAVPIADSEHGDPAGTLGGKLQFVPGALPGRQFPHLGHPGFQRADGPQIRCADAVQRQPDTGVIPAQFRVVENPLACQQMNFGDDIPPLSQPCHSPVKPPPLLLCHACPRRCG